MCFIFYLCMIMLIIFQSLITESRKLRLRTKIVGGSDAAIEDFPYQVALESQRQLICGGSIIGESYILTAAHCLDGIKQTRLQIRTGSASLQSDGEIRKVKKFIVHEKYNQQTSDYDAAILELTEPLGFTNKIQAIALPNANETLMAGQVGIISGWGHLKEDGVKSKKLQKVGVPILSRKQCVSTYEKEFPITPRMFCAGYLDIGGKDACQGDSGGPFNFNHKLYGITSWGIGCADKNNPGVYLAVPLIRKWIHDHTGI